MSVSALMKEQAEAWGLELTPEAFEAFDLYASRLKEANRTMNLTAVDDDEGIARRHFLDSLRPLVLGWLQPQARLVDVGTGAGFPGLLFLWSSRLPYGFSAGLSPSLGIMARLWIP